MNRSAYKYWVSNLVLVLCVAVPHSTLHAASDTLVSVNKRKLPIEPLVDRVASDSLVMHRVCFKWEHTDSEDSVKNLDIHVYTQDGPVVFRSVDSCFTFVLADTATSVRMDFSFDGEAVIDLYFPLWTLCEKWDLEVDRDPVLEHHSSLMGRGAATYFEICYDRYCQIRSQ